MNKTQELTKTQASNGPDSVRAGVAQRLRLESLAAAMRQDGQDLTALAESALEGALEAVGFERGFLFVLGEAARVSERESTAFEPLATRCQRPGQAGLEWGPVRNPEFAVSRALLKRAASVRDPILANDCLVPPAPGSEAQHRAVICQSYDLAKGVVGILYLDRALGRGEVGAEESEVLQEFSDRCFIFFLRQYAVEELDALRARAQSGNGGLTIAEADGENEPTDVDAAEGPSVEPEESPSFFGIVGSDEKLQKIFAVIRKIKDSDLNVCIFGESGTGKELLARAIHDAGNRQEKPFVGENCGAIPENLLESELFGHMKGAFTGADEDKKGLFEAATGGTLFLDEIGDMSEGMQRKLLRVLQEGVVRPIGGKQPVKVDVRVICASNRDLKVLVQKGTFRADLYYRLNVITIELPPLRDRPADVPVLVKHLAAKICEEEKVRKRFSQSAMRAFSEYPWPGNIRELRNVVRRVLITCPHRLVARKDVMGYLSNLSAAPRSGENIDRDEKDLVIRVPVRDSFNEIIEECERVVLQNALKQCAWNKSRVTKALKIPRQSLYNKIAKYKLEREWGTESSE